MDTPNTPQGIAKDSVGGYWRRFLLTMVLMMIVNSTALYYSSGTSDGERYIGWPYKAFRRHDYVIEFTFYPLELLKDCAVAFIVSHLVARSLKDGWRYGFRNLFLG